MKMTKKDSIKLGFLPTRRNVFDPAEAARMKDIVLKQIQQFENLEIITIDALNSEGLIFDAADAERAADIFIAEKVDAVFAPHCNFGTEDAVAKVGKLVGKPFLLWGPLDEAPDSAGFRMRDSQCGLFATSKALIRYNVPFSYITNSTADSRTFLQGFEDFIRIASVIKAFRSARIGQISTRPGAFLSVMVNEGELLEKFGVEVVPMALTELEERMNKIIKENSPEYQVLLDSFGQYDNRCLRQESLSSAAGMKIAIEQWAQEKSLSGVAIQCWDAMQSSCGIFPCFVNGLLTDSGLPVACETDILGALSLIMLKAAVMNQTPAFLADLTVRHPSNPNAELLWHCGNFPPSIAKSKVAIGPQGPNDYDVAGRFEARGGDLTLLKMDGVSGNYQLLMGEAKGTDGPDNAGTYIWAEFENWAKWERRVIYGPYIHHVGVVHGKVARIMYEACRYIPGLEPDCVEPTKEQLEEQLLYQ